MKKNLITSAAFALLLAASAGANAALITTTVGAFDGLQNGPFPVNYDLADFNFNLNGESVVAAKLTGSWGRTDTFCCTTAPGELYVDGLMVEKNTDIFTRIINWSYTFDPSELYLLADGLLDFTAIQTGSTYLRLGKTTLQIETAAVPEPATLALLSLGLAGLGFSRRRKAA